MGDLKVAAISISSELGGTERTLIDFAKHAPNEGIDLEVVMPRTGPLVEPLERHGATATIVTASTWLLRASQRRFSPFTFMAVPALLRWARAVRTAVAKADVVYSVGFKPHLVTRIARIRPTVWHLHEFPPAAGTAIWKRLVAWPDGIVTNSEATATAWGLPVETTVLNGVDLDLFRPGPGVGLRRELGLDPDALLIGMPAVFARWKGQVEVVRAFESIADAYPDAHLVLIGGPIYDTVAEAEYLHMIDRLVAGKARVHRTGFKSNIHEVLPDLDIAVHFSQRPEPFGRVVLEAMACGVPIIAAGEGGPLEILGATPPGRVTGGWLCEPRSTDSLQEALQAMIDISDEERRQIGMDARESAQRLSDRRFAAGVAATLKRVASAAGAGRSNV